MLVIEPAFYLKPTKTGDVRVPIDGHWEAQYGDLDWSCVIRECPIEAAAACLNNALFWINAELSPESARRTRNGN